ncbi:hypothetical protein L3X38_034363 [Prunus dulcis]|uniref:Uncharacterized protein n=1 Tax=Prunus dulcis TaxID=3755 RepID=A0AAD4VHN6_PRUDU|nr:hypothetical protein L3X38_034363 [Prunus dulcis]
MGRDGRMRLEIAGASEQLDKDSVKLWNDLPEEKMGDGEIGLEIARVSVIRDDAYSLNGFLGAQCSSYSCLSGELLFSAIFLPSFLPYSMARSDEGKEMGMYTGLKGVLLKYPLIFSNGLRWVCLWPCPGDSQKPAYRGGCHLTVARRASRWWGSNLGVADAMSLDSPLCLSLQHQPRNTLNLPDKTSMKMIACGMMARYWKNA